MKCITIQTSEGHSVAITGKKMDLLEIGKTVKATRKHKDGKRTTYTFKKISAGLFRLSLSDNSRLLTELTIAPKPKSNFAE